MIKNKEIDNIKRWIVNNDQGWKLEPEHFLVRKNKFYHNVIDLSGLQNSCIEGGELCLAFKGGFMVWLIEDSIHTAIEPTSPLFG